jgi:hypothetical protein
MLAIANMASLQPPALFARRYLFTTGIVHGGQSVVAFARDHDAGMRQYAIKCVLVLTLAVQNTVPPGL